MAYKLDPSLLKSGVSVLFSEPKIPQCGIVLPPVRTGRGFSALQRAENSSIKHARVCQILRERFSALQRAENSSIETRTGQDGGENAVSVLFSEPKIPQCIQTRPVAAEVRRFSALQRAENSSIVLSSPSIATATGVSVLFSEPKIPQFAAFEDRQRQRLGFSALQRAENSSMFNPDDFVTALR